MNDTTRPTPASATIAMTGAAATYTLYKRLATLVHDCVAHPLMWLTNNSRLSWRIHDWAGMTMLDGQPIEHIVLTIHNPTACVDAAQLLREAGFVVGCGGGSNISYGGRRRSSYEDVGWTAADAAIRVAEATAVGFATGRSWLDLVVGEEVAHGGKWKTIAAIDERGWVVFEGEGEHCYHSDAWRVKR